MQMNQPTLSCERRVSSAACWLVLALLVSSLGCASRPMGADRESVRTVYQGFNESALTGDSASSSTRSVLRRYDLAEAFEEKPASTLKRMHEIACADDRRDVLFALAELSYLHADRLARSFWSSRRRLARDRYLTTSIYAYLYLLGGGKEPPPEPFDRRSRTACELYNRALALGLAGKGDELALDDGPRQLSPGRVELRVVQRSPSLKAEGVQRYYAADRFRVRGFTVRNRTSGLGAPLIAVGRQHESGQQYRHLSATAFLRVDGDVRAWSRKGLAAVVELHSPYDTASVRAGGKTIPLVADTTAPLAYTLNNEALWKLGFAQFLTGKELIKSGLYTNQPYRPGRMQVVFVHGTMSSPVGWAEMWNALLADPVLRERCQVWNFVYNTGNPLSVSVDKLRTAIRETVAKLDPKGTDPGLQNMVVIGHSQGGLLTRMTVTDAGDKIWRVASDRPLDKLEVDDETREALRRTYFYPPLSCVKRVIFISTPHRGSYRVSSLARRVARWFISLPVGAAKLTIKAIQYPLRRGADDGKIPPPPNSIDGMSPDNKYLHVVAAAPFARGIKAHSIIAIDGDDRPPEGNDGVVTYRSAHLDKVESEVVVRSGHSCQGTPVAIEEVRRILLEHLITLPAAAPAGKSSAPQGGR